MIQALKQQADTMGEFRTRTVELFPGISSPEDRKPLTDLANAERLVERHGKDLRFSHGSRSWYVWTGIRWARDTTGEIWRRAKETVRSMYDEAGGLVEGEQDGLTEHTRRSESRERLSSMIALAQSEEGIPIDPTEFDRDPWLLNLRNGALDLRTGTFREHRREDLGSKLGPVEYDPEATCPTWECFLDRVMGGNKELVRYLQKAVGYSLTGDTREQCLFFLWGTGRNGKSTFLETIRRLLGDYACQMDFTSVLRTKTDKVRNDIARLNGARLVSAVEVEDGRALSEVVVKQLTGNDTVTARYLRSEFFEFKPTFKLWLAGNHKPSVKGTDVGIWRRIRLIPFSVTVPEAEVDPRLSEKLLDELPGILNWALEGLRLWSEEGLEPPEEVKKETNSYREEMDPVARFLEECCDISGDERTSAKALYEGYRVWAVGSGEEVLTKRKLAGRLKERGLRDVKSTGGRFYWQGIGLMVEEVDEVDE